MVTNNQHVDSERAISGSRLAAESDQVLHDSSQECDKSSPGGENVLSRSFDGQKSPDVRETFSELVAGHPNSAGFVLREQSQGIVDVLGNDTSSNNPAVTSSWNGFARSTTVPLHTQTWGFTDLNKDTSASSTAIPPPQGDILLSPTASSRSQSRGFFDPLEKKVRSFPRRLWSESSTRSADLQGRRLDGYTELGNDANCSTSTIQIQVDNLQSKSK
jgi:hypothetical protein